MLKNATVVHVSEITTTSDKRKMLEQSLKDKETIVTERDRIIKMQDKELTRLKTAIQDKNDIIDTLREEVSRLKSIGEKSKLVEPKRGVSIPALV